MSEFLRVPETASKLRALLHERGLSPNKRYGQNFLVDGRILDVVSRTAALKPADVVLEVGTGPGTLTQRLAEGPALVVTVEIDSGLYAMARDHLGHRPNIRLVHGDILDSKSRLNEDVCEKLDVALAAPGASSFKVVANLPYNISTPFLSSLLLRYGAPDLMVLMLQKELADNLAAEPGSKAYSPLTILIRLLADVKIERTLPRDVFWPKPRVESAIVVVRGRGGEPLPVLRTYPMVRFLFSERRKTLTTILRKLPAVMGGPMSKEAVGRVLESMELSGRERAEKLTPAQFMRLNRVLSEASERG